MAVLVAPDGDYVTDYSRDTIEDVESALADQGSRWYFYPFHAVVTDSAGVTRRKRLVSVAYPFEGHKGRTVGTFTKAIAGTPEDVLRAILEG